MFVPVVARQQGKCHISNASSTVTLSTAQAYQSIHIFFIPNSRNCAEGVRILPIASGDVIHRSVAVCQGSVRCQVDPLIYR